jgi:predicted amidohydrolase
MLRDGDEIYNAQMLFAPDGRSWRYDKNHPFAWERASFRGREGITVAETELGAIGMLICIDVIYPQLWRQYAGRVDLMLVSSCPPDTGHPTYFFPDGKQVTLVDMGPIFAKLENAVHLSFDEMLRCQAAWLGVPAVHAAGCGNFRSAIPNSRGYFLGLAMTAPKLFRHLKQSARIELACEIYPATCIRDASGRSLAAPASPRGDAVALAGVEIAEQRPVPAGPQPASPLPQGTTFFMGALAALAVSTYRRGIRLLKTDAS